ncbi:outer membrane beta-barrel protein [Sphingoaurantiacus capsulatus]|uniref:Outer membrane beta-barrel protein n=1 Tax=Sphingoaurantiacus capsulatus TaxID=1771310 RepID=A0ABV7XD40_9SPHN
MRFGLLLRSAATIAMMTSVAPVLAQVEEKTRLEENRENDTQSSELEQVGGRVGAFRVLPRIEAGLLFDDNVYATDGGERSDTIYRVAPSLLLTADTSRYRWDVRAGVEFLEFDKFDDESRTNYGAGTTFRTEVVRDTRLSGRLSYDVDHEDRGSPNALTSNSEPVKYKTFDTGLGFERDVSRILFGVDGGYRKLNFDDVERNNGTIDNNDDRDRSLAQVGGKIGYEFSPGYDFLVRASYDSINYDEASDDLGFDRDSKGFRITGGIGFELTRLLTGEIFAGYLNRNYDDARFQTTKDAIFGAGLIWSPTELTTVRINLDRSIEETVFPGYTGYLNTSSSVRVTHELTRQLTLNGGVNYSKNKYERSIGSTAAARSDDNYGAQASLRYQLNRLLYTSAGYEWISRESNLPASDYGRNKFLITLGAQF